MGRFATFGNELYSGRRSIDFVGRRKLWFTIGITLSVLSIALLPIRGLNPGIEFRGGSEFQVPKVSSTSESIGTDAVTQVLPGAEPKISTIGSNGVRVQTEELTADQTDEVKAALATGYGVGVDTITSSYVGPSWGSDVSTKAIQGLVIFLILVALVISLYFRTWKMAAAALVALIHDLIITVGVYALVGFEVTPSSVIGFLTILGYSLYDTVVVFDKVRENTDHITTSTRRTYAEAANLAVNQTLVRSINTSVVALLPVGSILFIGAFLLGAGTLRDLSLALFVGIAAGTYSSIFIATPLLVDLRMREPALKAHAEKILRRRREGRDGGPATTAVSTEPAVVGVGAGATVPTGSSAVGSEGSGGAGGSGARSSGSPHRSGNPARRQQPRRNNRGGRR